MLYTEQNVRDNIRNRDGKRVFYLRSGDQLTSGARDFLRRERIEILPADQAKPEHYVLENGAITLTGTGLELSQSDEVRKAYLGG